MQRIGIIGMPRFRPSRDLPPACDSLQIASWLGASSLIVLLMCFLFKVWVQPRELLWRFLAVFVAPGLFLELAAGNPTATNFRVRI